MSDLFANDPYEIRLLDPSQVSFCRGQGGVLQMTIDGKAYPEVVLHRTFPFTHPHRYISLRNEKGEEIAILSDIEGLDEESRAEVETELRFRYLIPVVERIDKIKQNPGMWVWNLQTNLGPLVMTMRNLHDHIQIPKTGRMLITDMDGRRCEIVDIDKLDAHSRGQLSVIL